MTTPIIAALDVYDRVPLAANHPLRIQRSATVIVSLKQRAGRTRHEKFPWVPYLVEPCAR